MSNPNIVLTRIDNRLIHGQVITQWVSSVGANLILVANDAISKNKMRQNLMNMVVPNGMAVRFFSIQKTIDIIHKAAPRQHIMIIVETPEDALRLVEGGVKWRHASPLMIPMLPPFISFRSLAWSWKFAAFLLYRARIPLSFSHNRP